jgi:hypothetical protein
VLVLPYFTTRHGAMSKGYAESQNELFLGVRIECCIRLYSASIVNVTVSPGQKLNRQKNITPITVSAEKNSCVNTGTDILNTSEYNTQF